MSVPPRERRSARWITRGGEDPIREVEREREREKDIFSSSNRRVNVELGRYRKCTE